jgi:hypothetical protein
MTGREAADEQERDNARGRREAAIQAQDKHDENSIWATQMITDSQLRYSQRETTLVPETQMSAMTQLSKTPSISSLDDSSTDPETDNSNPEPRRSGRVRKPTRAQASQLSQEAAAAAAKSPKGKKVRKAKLMNTSQLIEEFSLHQDE